MAKKKAKATKKVPAKKSHGELFDKHGNLIWLLPIFFIVAVIAVMAIKNMYTGTEYIDNTVMIEEESIIDTGEEMIIDEESMVEEGL